MLKNKQIVFLSITLLTLIFDQITKFLADKFLHIGENIVVIPSLLSVEKVYNTGAAFSILQNNTFLLILISLITLLLILIYIFKSDSKLTVWDNIALGFVTGGALGNLYDRLSHFFVIDFLQFDFIEFPIFNFADIFINIGVIILLISIFIVKNGK